MKKVIVFLIVISSLFLAFDFPVAEEPARVETFSPQGTVKNVKQVTVRFSEQVVAFGDPRPAEPFEILCPEKGRGRWADGKNWIYDYERDLPAGIVCEFTLKKEARTLSGKAFSGQQKFSFSTGGPSITESYPAEGYEGIDEKQIFVLELDAAAEEGSVIANVFCSIEGINERVGIRIIKDAERGRILKEYGRVKETALLLQCRQSFPDKAAVGLVWGKGVSSPNGVKTAEDQILSFRARGSFTAKFGCERENARANCMPMLPMRLDFSAPVSWQRAKRIVLRGAQKLYRPETATSFAHEEAYEGESEAEGAEAKDKESVHGVSFKGPFPENAAFVLELPKDFEDDAGRALSNRSVFPLTVRTDRFPPLAKFSARFGIIELNGDAALPLTLRNLEPEVKTRMVKVEKTAGGIAGKTKEEFLDRAVKLGEAVSPVLPGALKEKNQEVVEGLKGRLHRIRMDREEKVIDWLKKVASAEREGTILKGKEDVREFNVPKPGGGSAFEVVGIPLKDPGFYVVEMESLSLGVSLLDKQKPVFVPAGALVTNLSAHFKWGRESSLVWVTTLDKAEPVGDASVSLRDCNGRVIWEGKTDESGVARIKKQLPSERDLPSCSFGMNYSETSQALHGIGRGLFVFARTPKDMTFVHSSWDQGIEPWRFGLPYAGRDGQMRAHTVFDRSLLRAGETVHMKHLVRGHGMSGFFLPKRSELPLTVSIRHAGSDQRYEFPLKWDGKGISETEWKSPGDAKLGQYDVVLVKKAVSGPGVRTGGGRYEEGDVDWASGSFRIEEFRVPLMKAVIQPPKAPLINAAEVEVDLAVRYLSGGGAGNAKIKLRSRTQPRYVRFEDYGEFTFANGGVTEGVSRRARYEEGDDQESIGKPKLRTYELTLDGNGGLRTRISGLPAFSQPQEILAELEFRDPNGEVQTVSQKIPLWTSGVLVGIKPDSWASSKDNFRFHVAVLDLSGKAVRDKDVAVELFQKKSYSHRKRLVGGFYSYEHVTETRRIGPVCDGKTDTRGLVVCEAKSPVYGNVILQARAADDAGNGSVANREVWVTGKGEWWFDVSDHDRIDLLPEKKRYEPGEVAKLQVRMPFRDATALVTVEREGVIETYIKRISGKMPIVEIPVKKNYAPNVFVSVLVVRGRVSGAEPAAMVDLGKPAFKLGIAEINVGWKANELKVKVSPDRDVYRVREKARVKVKVKSASGNLPPPGSEVTVAAVDEGLLELQPNNSWKLLESMMGRRGYEVLTASAQMQVVGKRHYGLKALPHGGGGGRQVTRELFDTLLFWKARVPLNERGEAEVEIPLNDSLTSFRIVAVANGGKGMFGTGQASVRTAQDLMVLSGLPRMVREGDRFRAGFTLRNASNRQMDVEVKASILDREKKELEGTSETLSPGESREIGWEIEAPRGVDTVTYEVTAREKGGDAGDNLKVKQKVVEAVPVRTYQASLMQVERDFALDVERPIDALPGKGGIDVSLRPKLSGGLGGVTLFMKRYPYTCMEQKVSRAIALRDETLWKSVMAELPALLDSEGLVKYFSSMALGSDVLTSYILSIAQEAGWEIPADARGRMEGGLKGFVEGKVMRHSSLPTADLSIRKIAAVDALARTGKAEPGLLGSITIEPNLWPTSAVIDWMNVLLRLKGIPGREGRLKEAEQILRARINFQGTMMGFSTEGSDHLWWLMVSTDLNAVKSILAVLDLDNWNQDMPRLVRGALGRQHRGAWNLTTANAWGVLAMEKFSKRFEAVPVSGITSASLGETAKTVDWSRTPEGKGLSYGWPKGKKRLTVKHQGTGRPWAAIQSLAAIPLGESFSSGYGIKKTLAPVEQKTAGKWSMGDVVRVRLEIEAQADMTWVVVSDPVPAGSGILGTGLGRDSELLSAGEKKQGWVWPAFEERSFEAFRAYYEFVPKGKWTVEYTIRLNNSGTFQLPATRAEALYAPEMLGELSNQEMRIGP